MYKYYNLKLFWVTTLLLLVLTVTGCERSGIRVVPVPSNQILTLSPEDITEIMRMAGFTDAQIADLGTEVWAGLARSGMVQIRIRGRVEVIFTVNSKTEVSFTSMTRGYHEYNINTGWVNNAGKAVKQPSKSRNQEPSQQEQEPDTTEPAPNITED
jgi:hypothetical protein